jgi:hypothetical protein
MASRVADALKVCIKHSDSTSIFKRLTRFEDPQERSAREYLVLHD